MFPFQKKKNFDITSQLLNVDQQHTSSPLPTYSVSNPNLSNMQTSSPSIRLDKKTLNISSSPIANPVPVSNNYSERLNSSTIHPELTLSNGTLMNKKNSNRTYPPETDGYTYDQQLQFSTNANPSTQAYLPSFYSASQTPPKYQPQLGIRNSVAGQNQGIRPVQKIATSKRIWVKKNSHTATTITVGPNDIVDDLKYMIANKFPTTLALQYDPADLVIKLNIPIDNSSIAAYNNNNSLNNNNNSSSNHIIPKLKCMNSDESNSPLSTNTIYPKPIITNEIVRSNTPISPEPTLQSKSSMLYDQTNIDMPSVQNSMTRPLVLEPDMLVFSVVDKYFPNGMKMSDAFIIDVVRSATEEKFKIDTKARFIQSSQTLNTLKNSLDRPDFLSTDSINQTTNDKVAILGEQKVPPPRLKPYTHPEILSGATPQSSAVILFSKDFRDTSKSPSSGEAFPLPHSPKARKDNNETQSSPKNTAETVCNDSAETNEKLNLQAEPESTSTKDNEALKASEPSSTFPTPTSDSTLTPKISDQKTASTLKKRTATDKKHGMPKILSHINVLVVEDNLVNQKIMARHLKSCNVQFQIASTGKEALEIWKKGGFHLCFMDIQLPFMSGIEVTKEIRRLERLNHIGSISNHNGEENHIHTDLNDVLDLSLFRSPIIIVALTASTGATDQQNALAAGCNDYLTKPVQLKWLKNKLTEWGYMQALINYDYFKSET
jgi:osomolarity two-component system response regulator SSK1